MHFSTLLTLAASVQLSIAGYVLEDDYTKDFFSNFDFFDTTDPTNGFVKYVDQAAAQSSQLISTSNGSIYMGVDHTNMAPNGRSSVRISSKKTYESGLIVLDLAHMPVGCGTWPAFWTVGPNWPTTGEIDILEGVNEQVGNAMTLHTGSGCSISNGGGFSGDMTTSNCDVNAADQAKNAGCQIFNNASNSYGAGLNAIQGGVYATEWTDSAINVYFFQRGQVPSDITSGSPNPSSWGTPSAVFQGGCDIGNTFKQQQIVFDTTFCGDWAGAVWNSSSCASKADTCNAFVQNNPTAFADAYWSINSLKVYQSNGGSSNQTATIPGVSSTAAIAPSVSIPGVSAPSSLNVPSTFAVSTLTGGLPIPSGAPTTQPGFPSPPGMSASSSIANLPSQSIGASSAFPTLSSLFANEGLSSVTTSSAQAPAQSQVQGQMASFLAYPTKGRAQPAATTAISLASSAASSATSQTSSAVPSAARNVAIPAPAGEAAASTSTVYTTVLETDVVTVHARAQATPRVRRLGRRGEKQRLRRYVKDQKEGDEVLNE